MARSKLAPEDASVEPATKKNKREPVTIEHGSNGNGGSSRAVTVRKTTAVGQKLDWRKEIGQYAARTIKMEENVSVGNRISFKGGIISYKGVPLKNNELYCIVAAALIENAYYPGKYNPDAPTAPICFAFSEDGEDMAPHDKAHEKQNDTCEGCPQNDWGSADTGRGKACKNVRRLALLPLQWPFKEADVEEVDIATATIPVTSVKAWSLYSRDLAQKSNLPPWAWQTRIWPTPDPKSQFLVHFESTARQPIPEKLYDAIFARVKEAERMINEPYIYVAPETVDRAVRGKKPGGKGANNIQRRAKY